MPIIRQSECLDRHSRKVGQQEENQWNKYASRIPDDGVLEVYKLSVNHQHDSWYGGAPTYRQLINVLGARSENGDAQVIDQSP